MKKLMTRKPAAATTAPTKAENPAPENTASVQTVIPSTSTTTTGLPFYRA